MSNDMSNDMSDMSNDISNHFVFLESLYDASAASAISDLRFEVTSIQMSPKPCCAPAREMAKLCQIGPRTLLKYIRLRVY